MKKFVLVIFITLLVASPTWVFAKKVLYIQSFKAKLLTTPNFAAEEIISLSKGNEVEVLDKNARWTQVQVNNKQGWVSSMLLAPNKPLKKPSLLQKLKTTGHNLARKRASVQTTAGATRGLQDKSRLRANGHEQANYDALNTVEENTIDEQDARQFHKELANTK